MNDDKNKKTSNSEVKKENQDLPNLPAATEKVKDGDNLEKEIKKSSKLNPDGKTDNTEQNSEN